MEEDEKGWHSKLCIYYYCY